MDEEEAEKIKFKEAEEVGVKEREKREKKIVSAFKSLGKFVKGASSEEEEK